METAEQANKEYIQLMQKVSEACDVDMTDAIYKGNNGKVGLTNYKGEIILPAEYDSIPEVYNDSLENPEFNFVNLCSPVVVNGKYGLVNKEPQTSSDNRCIAECIYDRIFRVFNLIEAVYVCEKNGKKGLLSITDAYRELVPCYYDEVYAPIGFNGTILFSIGHHYYLYYNRVITQRYYDDVELVEYQPVRVKDGQSWYYLDEQGNPATDAKQAWFMSSEMPEE